MPVPLCHLVDAVRKFDPRLTESNVRNENYIGNTDAEQLYARIDAVSDTLEQRTGRAFRQHRVGAPDAPATWEYADATSRSAFVQEVDLDHDDILPFDSTEDDSVEIRTSRDSWEDITDEQGDEWVLVPDTGELKVFRYILRHVYWEARDERFLRATYRYGALGGDRSRSGQTTLSSSATATTGTDTLDVADSSRLPYDGGVILVGERPDLEYVRATSVDTGADTVTVRRAVQGTTAEDHASGVPVHYCPESVRDAVAGMAAAELVRYDDFVEQVDEDQEAVSATAKIDQWEQAFVDVCARESGVRRM